MSAIQNNHQLVGEALMCERGGRVLFENLEFSISSGQAMVIQGSNGAGKTSLLRIITGLSPPANGMVSWNQNNIENIAEEFQEQLLYIGHLAAVKRELTVRENLQLLKRFWPTDAAGSIAELAENVGLRQRFCVCCARLPAGHFRPVRLASRLIYKGSS